MSDTQEAVATRELPKYKCYKEVWALKIKGVHHRAILKADHTKDIVIELHFEDDGYGPIEVTDDWLERHGAGVGGYYVVYDDGYASFSSAEEFEAGYKRI